MVINGRYMKIKYKIMRHSTIGMFKVHEKEFTNSEALTTRFTLII